MKFFKCNGLRDTITAYKVYYKERQTDMPRGSDEVSRNNGNNSLPRLAEPSS